MPRNSWTIGRRLLESYERNRARFPDKYQQTLKRFTQEIDRKIYEIVYGRRAGLMLAGITREEWEASKASLAHWLRITRDPGSGEKPFRKDCALCVYMKAIRFSDETIAKCYCCALGKLFDPCGHNDAWHAARKAWGHGDDWGDTTFQYYWRAFQDASQPMIQQLRDLVAIGDGYWHTDNATARAAALMTEDGIEADYRRAEFRGEALPWGGAA